MQFDLVFSSTNVCFSNGFCPGKDRDGSVVTSPHHPKTCGNGFCSTFLSDPHHRLVTSCMGQTTLRQHVSLRKPHVIIVYQVNYVMFANDRNQRLPICWSVWYCKSAKKMSHAGHHKCLHPL